MAKKLYGTDPDQVPTNADLGTIAYQDKDNFNLGGANNSESKLVMGKFTDRDVFYQYGENIPTLMVQNDDYSSNDGVGIILDSNQRAGFYTENGDAHLRTWIKHPVDATYGHFIYQVAVGLDDPENNGTEVFRIKGSGDILPQGNVVMPNGHGIDFSASEGSGASSSVLDDYEEGTFTPAFENGTFTYGNRSGWYVKVGNVVTVAFMVIWSAKSGSGNIEVGLPFSSSSTPAALRAAGPLGFHNGIDYDGYTSVHWRLSASSSVCQLGLGKDQASSGTSLVENMSAAGEVQGTITYKTA